MGGKDLDFDIDSLSIDSLESEDVFYFVFDWRLDNAWKQDGKGSANKLEEFITKITGELDYPRVNILAHSMGGLVCKSLLEKKDSVHQSINKIMFLGTPNLGAVESFSTLAHGLEAPMIGNTISLNFIQRTETLIDGLNSFNIADADIASFIPDIIDKLNLVINSNDPADCSEVEKWARGILTSIAAVKGILNPASSYTALLSILDELNRLYGFDKDINFIKENAFFLARPQYY